MSKKLMHILSAATILMGLMLTGCPDPAATPAGSDKAILSFYLTSPVAIGSVNETDHTVSVTVLNGTVVTSLVPTIAYTGASVSPASGTAQNFINPVVYTITAADGSTQAYTVTVTVAPVGSYIITFDKNDSGASGSMSSQTVQNGTSAILTSNAFTKTGWTFTGWATTPAGAVTYADGAYYTMGTANVTLYAKWTANNYTITFDKDDAAATGTMPNQTIACGSSANLTANAFANTGYVFAGWATTSGGSVVYADKASYTMGASNVTLYAVWGLPPTVTTVVIAASQSGDNKFGNIGLSTNITGTGAQGGGTVTSDGRAPVTERGVCWNTTGSPTVSGPHSASGSGTGDFTANMTGLTANTTYHVRAYAINSIGTSYGNEVTFNSGYTIGSIHDGGYLFYNDGNGHGMVAGMNDLADAAFDDGAKWNTVGNITSSLFGMGQKNTIDLSNDTDGINHTYPAANACHNYTDGTYHDWFLPSVDELMLMITHLNANGGGFVNDYWSSSTSDPTWAYFVAYNGYYDINHRFSGLSIRPARIFGF